MTMKKRIQPVAPWCMVLMDHRPVGKLATIWVKIMIDMPLPTPRSVMSSPIHMMMPVPAVITMTMVISGKSSWE